MIPLFALMCLLQDDPPKSEVSKALHGEVVRFRMIYTEPYDPGKAPAARRGGLIGGVNFVAASLAGAGGSSTMAGALVEYDVEPVVEETPAGVRTLRLKIRSDGPQIDPVMSDASRAVLVQEASFLAEELARWTKTLENTTLLEIRSKGSVAVPVIRPLTGVQKWKHEALTLPLKGGAAVPRITAVRYFLVGRSGVYPAKELVVGMPAIVEAEYDREPAESEADIEVDALPQGLRKLRGIKLTERPTLFRTARFLVWSSDGGLDVPAPLRRDR